MQRFQPWLTELWLIGTATLLVWLPFNWFGYGAEFLIVALAAYLAWHLYQLRQFVFWLSQNARAVPDNVPGVWHEIYHQIYLAQKRRRRTKRRLTQIIGEFRDSTNALHDAAVTLGSYGEIIWFNHAARELLGLRTPQDVGQRISNLLRHPKFVEFEARSESEAVLEIPSPLDVNLTLSFQILPYRQGQRLLMVRDVTRVHKLEQMRQDFVANVSHELRTPITVLMGYLETLSSGGEEKLGRYARPVSQMQQQALRMRAIVDDLLLLSRLDTEHNRLKYEPVDVPALLKTMADDARVLSGNQQHEIQTELDDNLGLMAAPKELQSAFGNLIANAVRYTPAGGQVTLRWQCEPGGGARFEVVDTGPGIEAQHLPRLTERFYRVDAGRSREVGGTGLGLAIVKHVLERHGARLQISSTVGVGSRFACLFPASVITVLKR
ncbi:phosphate regulon sensor histidine kinase PhoR [Permianibacter sp. IMCC34836]|uniref:phosphate regulon sensor histidine kinase PhoR n=1 Tax=Permianibacter fluminis TaxID=2738515 RepID=UPI001554501A|nr:phosphate regulon sensor histidine kinase PhoR [Permianibacter fluminis]NQD38474.1 phosphate regulon sensor histidine kinase PhoR [Permianibacter fluminis]